MGEDQLLEPEDQRRIAETSVTALLDEEDKKTSVETPVHKTKYKVELCRFWQRGACTRGRQCTFAHGEADRDGAPAPAPVALQPQTRDDEEPHKFKTELCRFWNSSTPCKRGAECSYAHDVSELRAPAAGAPVGGRNVGRPKSLAVERPHKYKTQACKFWETGKCTRGRECTFAHSELELRPWEAPRGYDAPAAPPRAEYPVSMPPPSYPRPPQPPLSQPHWDRHEYQAQPMPPQQMSQQQPPQQHMQPQQQMQQQQMPPNQMMVSMAPGEQTAPQTVFYVMVPAQAPGPDQQYNGSSEMQWVMQGGQQCMPMAPAGGPEQWCPPDMQGGQMQMGMPQQQSQGQFVQMPMGGQMPMNGQMQMGGGIQLDGPMPMAGQMPLNGQMPMDGQMQMGGGIPLDGPMPVNSQMPMDGQMQMGGQMPIGGPMPMGGQIQMGYGQMQMGYSQVQMDCQMPMSGQNQMGGEMPAVWGSPGPYAAPDVPSGGMAAPVAMPLEAKLLDTCQDAQSASDAGSTRASSGDASSPIVE